MVKLNAQELRTQKPNIELKKAIKKSPIYIVLDNVLDTYNVGAIFRLADAIAAQKIFLCGETETPPNPKIKKASINTWQWVDWEYVSSTFQAVSDLKSQVNGLSIISVEQHDGSKTLSRFKPEFPLVLIVGNETYGISKEVLSLSDHIIELPMMGINKSLNVMVSCGIVLYRFLEYL
jgi:23S rRNA (guanosine2251-2'-O)-methyltransferase